MVLEISAITNSKLQKLALKVDNGDHLLDQTEIGELLTKMAKKKYSSDDMKSILELETQNLNENDKISFYNNCIDKLEQSLHKTKGSQIGETKIGCEGLFGVALGGILGFTANVLSDEISTSAKQYLTRMTKFGAVGAAVGGALLTLVAVTKKIISKEQEARLNTKESYIETITKERNTIRED